MKSILGYITRFFKKNTALKFSALFISLGIWLYVVSVQSPDTTKIYKNIPIEFSTAGTMPSSLNLMVCGEKYTTVDVTIKGDRADLISIQSDQIIVKPDYNSITGPGSYELPLIVTFVNAKTELHSLSYDSITVEFDYIEEKTLPVQIVQTGESSFGKFNITARPESVKIRGPKELIDQVTDARVEFDVTGLTTTTIRNSVPVKLYSTSLSGAETEIINSDITINPREVNLTGEIIRQKTVPVIFSIVNSAGGYVPSFIIPEISPSEITLEGPDDLLEKIHNIDLGTLDIATYTGDYSQIIDISDKIPNGLITDSTSVSVSVDLSDLAVRDFHLADSDYTKINLPAGRSVRLRSTVIRIIGQKDAVDSLELSDITATVDIANDTALSEYTLKIELAPGIKNAGALQGEYKVLKN